MIILDVLCKNCEAESYCPHIRNLGRNDKQLNHVMLCMLEFVFFNLDQYKNDHKNENSKKKYEYKLSNQQRLYKLS